MKQTDSDLMLAVAQVKLAYMLIGGILALAFATLALAFYNDKFSSLSTTIATGILTLAGTAAGFFLSRQRQSAIPDPTVTSTTTTTTTTPTPLIVPEGSKIVPAPAPAAIITPTETPNVSTTAPAPPAV